MVSVTSVIKRNKKSLKSLKTINQQLLNNRISPIKSNNSDTITSNKKIDNDETYGFITKRFPADKNLQSGRYKPYDDDSLYHGVNLISRLIPLSTSPSPQPSLMTEKYYDNYGYYLHEELNRDSDTNSNNNNNHHQNNNILYMHQLNESLRRKGYKFTLADIDRCDESNLYRGEYLEDEGYLV
ncbi:unnamed protein product [Diamesa serratosioi]